MVCNICGRSTQNEEANFCEYCGNSFREQTYHVEPEKKAGAEEQASTVTEKPTTFLNWLGTYGLLFIPVVGVIVFLVMMIYWSVTNRGSESKKNWARATLVFLAVYIIMLVYFLTSFMGSDIFKEMLMGTYDLSNSGLSGLLLE